HHPTGCVRRIDSLAQGTQHNPTLAQLANCRHDLSGVAAQAVNADHDDGVALACIEPSAGRVTVSAVYQTWYAAQSHISAKTAASRKSAWSSRVEPQWGDTLVVEVRSSAIRGWVASMVAEGTGTAIIENAFGVLRQVLGAAVEDNRHARNPCDGVKL